MKMSKRLMLLLVLALSIVAGTGVLSSRTRENLVDSTKLVAHTHEILEEMDAFLTDMVDAETG